MMTELDHATTAGAATMDPPLVTALRQRHEKLRRESALPPFEMRMQDGASYSIGEEGKHAFSVRIVTNEGLAALGKFDELAIAEAYMDGDLDSASGVRPRRRRESARRARDVRIRDAATELAGSFKSSGRSSRALLTELLSNDAPKGLFERLGAILNVLAKSPVNQALVVSATRGSNLRPEPIDYVRIKPNRDSDLAWVRRDDGSSPPF